MHGYELRKRLYTVLGAFRTLSYGSLYPCLQDLLADGLIVEEHDEAAGDEARAVDRPAARARAAGTRAAGTNAAARSRAGRRS